MKWAFILVLVAEFLVFDRMTSRHYSGIYPRWNDQIETLNESYTGYEYRLAHGFLAGLGHTLNKPAAQGTLHSFWAMLAFEVAGEPSRTAALAVNMLAFIAWQAALLFALRRGTGSYALGWVALGLTLGLRWPWYGVQGSATDFRLDHVTMGMMGISLVTALQTKVFRSTAWSAVFGGVVGVTLLTRFLSGTYFALIFGACLLWILLSCEARLRRSLNLGLSALVATLLLAPCLWVNRQLVYEHYWIGHYYDADGALWISHASLSQAIAQFWTQLSVEQLGPGFGAAAGAALLWLGAGAWFSRRKPVPPDANGARRWTGEAAILGAIFLLAPGIVLPLQNQPFGVVLGVAVPGAILVLLALAAKLNARVATGYSVAAAVTAFALGAGYYVARQTAAPYDANFVADNHRINSIADRIFATSRAAKLDQPTIAVDRIADYFDAQILRVICYERHKVWMSFAIALPVGLSAIPEDMLMGQLIHSDFVLATEEGPTGPWPYDRQTLELRPKILTWCEANLRAVERFTVFGQRMVLYQRRDLPVP
jgi:hypothetical protein